MDLAQAVVDATEQGISAEGWVLIIGAVLAALTQLFTALGWTKAAKVASEAKKTGDASVHAIETFSKAHPEQAMKIKKMAYDQAKALGVGVSLRKTVDRVTTPLKKVAPLLLCAILLCLAGCSVGQKAAELIETECRAHDATLSEWDSLSDEQQKDSHEDSRAGVYEIRFDVLGIALPDDLQERMEREKALEAGE